MCKATKVTNKWKRDHSLEVSATLLLPAEDDAGAQTASRYEWQACMAAVDALGLIMQRSNESTKTVNDRTFIVCEHHEDYVVQCDETIELVSVKHRDASKGAWTLATLTTDGGLCHLFRRWREFRGGARVRLVTNAGLAAGSASQLRALGAALREDSMRTLPEADHGLLLELAKSIFRALDQDERDTNWGDPTVELSLTFFVLIRRYLSDLVLDVERTNRHDLTYTAPMKYVAPVLDFLGMDGALSGAVWEQVVAFVRPRMRGEGASPSGGIGSVLQALNRASTPQRVGKTLEKRTLKITDVLEVVKLCADLELASVSPPEALAPTTLTLKLVNSGCKATTAHAAEAAATRWLAHENDLREVPFGEAEIAAARAWANLRASAIHESVAASQSEPYGPAMWLALMDELRVTNFPTPSAGMSDELLLGAACQLASECRVWFSDEFNLEDARRAFPKPLGAVDAKP